jgi:hypothetical protein
LDFLHWYSVQCLWIYLYGMCAVQGNTLLLKKNCPSRKAPQPRKVIYRGTCIYRIWNNNV